MIPPTPGPSYLLFWPHRMLFHPVSPLPNLLRRSWEKIIKILPEILLRIPVSCVRLIHSDWKLKKLNKTLHFLLRERLYVGKGNYTVVGGLLWQVLFVSAVYWLSFLTYGYRNVSTNRLKENLAINILNKEKEFWDGKSPWVPHSWLRQKGMEHHFPTPSLLNQSLGTQLVIEFCVIFPKTMLISSQHTYIHTYTHALRGRVTAIIL